MNYRDPSGHGIKSKLKNAWGKVISAVSRRTHTGYTSYSYVKYNRNRSYGLVIGGIIRYFQTEAVLNIIRNQTVNIRIGTLTVGIVQTLYRRHCLLAGGRRVINGIWKMGILLMRH